MRAIHEDALICDFAQYYHVLNIDTLDVRTAAVLALGLPEKCRVIREMRETGYDPDLLYRYSILDAVRNVEWAVLQAHSKKKLKRPKSLVKKLLEKNTEQVQEIRGFDTPEEFEAAKLRILEGT